MANPHVALHLRPHHRQLQVAFLVINCRHWPRDFTHWPHRAVLTHLRRHHPPGRPSAAELFLGQKTTLRRQGVCVKRLYRRKTSMALLNLVFWYYFSFQTSRGMECASDVSIQRRRICCTVIWIGDAQSTYLLNIFSFSSMATG